MLEYALSDKLGNRFYLDLSKIKKPNRLKIIDKINWFTVVDELIKLKFSIFY